MKTIYELEFMEEIKLPQNSANGKTDLIRRVPNGWIFTTIMLFGMDKNPSVTTIFVPKHDEFKPKKAYIGLEPSIIG